MNASTGRDTPTPTDADEVYFELAGARIHTQDLAPRPAAPSGFTAPSVDRIIDVTARLLGDLSLLWRAIPLAAHPTADARRGDLLEVLRAASGTFRDVADLSETKPNETLMSVDEIAAHRDRLSREWSERTPQVSPGVDQASAGAHSDTREKGDVPGEPS